MAARRAEEQVITARLLLERRGQSMEHHTTCATPMIPQEGGYKAARCVRTGERVYVCVCEGDTEKKERKNILHMEAGSFYLIETIK